jgi:hypothetical protein
MSALKYSNSCLATCSRQLPWPSHDLACAPEAHFLGNACSAGNRAVWKLHRLHDPSQPGLSSFKVTVSTAQELEWDWPLRLLILIISLPLFNIIFPSIFSSFFSSSISRLLYPFLERCPANIKGKESKIILVLNYLSITPLSRTREWSYNPIDHDLDGTRRRWFVSFTLQPLYIRRKSPTTSNG